MKKQFKLIALLLISGVIAFSSCKDDKEDEADMKEMEEMVDETTPPATKTLYEKLGGMTMVADPSNNDQMIEQGRLGLRSVVDSTIFVIAGDEKLQPYFEVLLAEVGASDLSGFTVLSKNLTDFFCKATGATSYTYSGMNMTNAHDPAKNTRMAEKADDPAFDAFIADLVVGAKKNGLSDELIGEVGTLVETLRTTIVQRQ